MTIYSRTMCPRVQFQAFCSIPAPVGRLQHEKLEIRIFPILTNRPAALHLYIYCIDGFRSPLYLLRSLQTSKLASEY